MSEFKALPLRRENIDSDIETFLDDNTLQLRSANTNERNVKRIIIGRPGIDDAMLDCNCSKFVGKSTYAHQYFGQPGWA